ncbi:endoribonuclease MazF [bacterium]|nr:endoribonuclease MazF [bacterium]
MSKAEYCPDRGDIIWLNFNPQSGHEQKGKRPAIVLSPMQYNSKVGLAVICPITNQIKNYPFEVKLPEKLKITGVILSDQIKSLDWKIRNAEFIAKVPGSIVEETINKFSTLIDL